MCGTDWERRRSQGEGWVSREGLAVLPESLAGIGGPSEVAACRGAGRGAGGHGVRDRAEGGASSRVLQVGGLLCVEEAHPTPQQRAETGT